MDLAPLLISEEEAKERLAQYEAQIEAERTAEDEAIRMGYRAAARGMPVFSLQAAFEAAGQFPAQGTNSSTGLPRLAIVRADATECRVYADSGDWVFTDILDSVNRGALVGKHSLRVPNGARDEQGRAAYVRGAKTVVPIIPPKHRPRRHRIRGFHIVWEVEKWDPTPPVDPALVRHIRGDLWSVVATWDLTELERRVLFGRR